MGSANPGEPARVPVQEAVEAGEKIAHGVGRLDDGNYGEVRGVKSRDDVIKGLECHKRGKYGEIDEHGFACNSCPYKDMESTCRSRTEGDLISDALALLKAQEPRVMTWKEIVDAAPQMPFIWLESKENHDRVFQSILFKTWLFDSTVTIITVMTHGWLFEGYHVDYGKAWRCWTSRPDNATREATPWNDTHNLGIGKK